MPGKETDSVGGARRESGENSGAEGEGFEPAISPAENYHKYLQLVHTGSMSDDENDNVVGGDKYLKESGYDPLASPTYEGSTPSGDSQVYVDPAAPQKSPEELQAELEKVEGEIAMLRQVLGSKVRYATELKRQMGITPFQEFKSDLQSGLQHIKESDTYQKTSSAVKTASEKTTAAVSTLGGAMSRKLGDIRNSQTFKSLEEKVEHTYANVKAKVAGSKSNSSIDEALKEGGEAAAGGEEGAEVLETKPVDLGEEKNVPL